MNAQTKIETVSAENHKTIAEAIVALQAELRPAIKEAQNEAFKRGGTISKYADLTAIWGVCREPLARHGLSVVQSTNFDATDVWLETTLLHKTGEKIVGRYPLRPLKQDPQGFGSAMTYARRYTLAAMLGVVAEEDDDGNAASGRSGSVPEQSALITPKQLGEIRNLVAETGTDIERLCKHLGVDALPDLDAVGYERAITALNKKRKPVAQAAE